MLPPPPGDGTPGPAPVPAFAVPGVTLEGLLLLDSPDRDPVPIARLVFDGTGIGVVRRAGERPRVLPWASVAAYAVEPWSGGIVPEWWVDPGLERTDPPVLPDGPTVVDPTATARTPLHSEAGTLVTVRTPYGIYRFLHPGGDTAAVRGGVTALARAHAAPAGASSDTTVAGSAQATRRARRLAQAGGAPTTWSVIQPVLVVALVVFVVAAVTLILLQSAGVVHLPYLGGTGPPSSGAVVVSPGSW